MTQNTVPPGHTPPENAQQQSEKPQQPQFQRQSHDIEYEIIGEDMQMVEVILDPEETVVAENGAMTYFEQGIQMDTHITDGSEQNSGILGGLLGAAKRKMSGENLFLAFFTNKGTGKKRVAFTAPFPGRIIPIDLARYGGQVYCQKQGFLAGSRGTAINVGFTKRVGAGMFGGEGFLLQSLTGDGIVFVHSGGTIVQRDLEAGEKLYVDTGSIVAFQNGVQFDIKMITGMKNIMFGGEEFFLSTLVGPGRVWIQSLPYPRLVTNIRDTMISMQKKKK